MSLNTDTYSGTEHYSRLEIRMLEAKPKVRVHYTTARDHAVDGSSTNGLDSSAHKGHFSAAQFHVGVRPSLIPQYRYELQGEILAQASEISKCESGEHWNLVGRDHTMPHRVCLINQLQLEYANNSLSASMEFPPYHTGLHEVYLKTSIAPDQPQENGTISKKRYDGTCRVEQPFTATNPAYRHCEYRDEHYWSTTQQLRSSLTRIDRSPCGHFHSLD
jgi:hypothetical protein